VLSWIKQFEVVDDSDPLKGFHSVKGGMTTLTNELVSRLKILSNVSLIYGENVVEVTKKKNTFDVMTTSSEIPFEGKKLILACNKGGIDMISWQSPKRRGVQFQQLFSNISTLQAAKVFLTYKEAWWEKAGLTSGRIYTDLPISSVTALGPEAKSNGYSTLMAAFTFRYTEVFKGLNQFKYERFKPSAGEIAAGLLPSQKLVDYVQDQLCRVFCEFI